MKKIVLCGGGTLGHVYPALALVPYLEKEYEIHFIGSGGIEREELKKYNYIYYHEIDAPKFHRKNLIKNFSLPYKFIKAKKSAQKILEEIKPDIIFAKGGYVTLPVIFATKHIPIICHESDISFGLANKLALLKCNLMITSFKITQRKNDKCMFIGQPIRDKIFKGNASKIKNKFKNQKPIILFLGGSLGSKFINKIAIENLDELTKSYNVILISGTKNEVEIKHDDFFSVCYVNNIEDYYASSDVVVTRSGSGTINELLSLKKLMLLLPLSKKASRGDQIENAKYFEKLSIAKVIEEKDFSSEKLLKNIDFLIKNKDFYYKNMQNIQNCNINYEISQKIKEFAK